MVLLWLMALVSYLWCTDINGVSAINGAGGINGADGINVAGGIDSAGDINVMVVLWCWWY